MKKLRIKPGINSTIAVWILEEFKNCKWRRIFSHDDINVVKKMKDHLLQLPVVYTIKNNIPEIPLKNRPSNWILKPKVKRMKVKKSDLPESLQKN